jgi:Tfp pilus assembly protein PilF
MSANPEILRAAYASAVAHHKAGRLEQAVADYRKARSLHPDSPDILNNLGIALKALGRLDEALETLTRAHALRPGQADYAYNLGNALSAAGRDGEAERVWRKALENDPDHAGAHGNLANLLEKAGRHEDALEHYRAACRARPERADAWNSLGAFLFNRRHWEAAEPCLRRALHLDPGHGRAAVNLGILLSDLARYDDALAWLGRAVALEPRDPGARAALGQLLVSRGEPAAALIVFDRILAGHPEHPEAQVGRARALLLAGRLREGFGAYEARWLRPESQASAPKLALPTWDGRREPGLKLLVWSEQGLGDIIQFARYLPPLAEQGLRVALLCPAPLVKLLRALPGLAGVADTTRDLPACTHQIPLLSLPRLSGTELDSIPAPIPYLPLPEVPARPDSSGRFRIGIVWSGNPRHRNDRNRSCPLGHFLGLAGLPGVELVSLQKGDTAQALDENGARNLVEDWGPRLGDFSDTAAALAELDLLISVDTSVVHLAGALGRPAWVLLAYAPDWRWLLGRDDSPWYPGLRLFRQPEPGDWAGLFGEVKAALAGRLAGN